MQTVVRVSPVIPTPPPVIAARDPLEGFGVGCRCFFLLYVKLHRAKNFEFLHLQYIVVIRSSPVIAARDPLILCRFAGCKNIFQKLLNK